MYRCKFLTGMSRCKSITGLYRCKSDMYSMYKTSINLRKPMLGILCTGVYDEVFGYHYHYMYLHVFVNL